MAQQNISVSFSANITQFQNAMNKMANSVKETTQEISNKAKEIGDAFTPIATGIAGIAGASMLASSQMSDGISNFQTKLGASGSDLKEYEGMMKSLAGTGVGSFDEVSNAIIDVKKNMDGLSNADLEMISGEAMHLAQVMGSDVNEVSKTAGIMMKQFGISGAEAMDLIAKGYQNGMDYAGDYQDTLSEYSVYFKSMGFGAEDMFNILAEGAEKGAFNLDKVGDAMKEFGIRSKDGSDTSKEAFKALGMDADKLTATFAKGGEEAKKAYAQVVTELSKVEDQAKRNEIGVALFGTQYEDMEKDVIASTGTIVDHMKNVEGASMEVAQNNKTFSQEMQGAWNQIAVALKPVGDALKNAILKVMPHIITAVQNVSTAFQGLSPTMQTVVLAFGGVVAVLPLLLAGFAGIMTMIGTLSPIIPLLVKGFSLLNSGFGLIVKSLMSVGKAFMWLGRLFLTNPFLLIITAIIVVAVLIYKHWDEISVWLSNAWNWIKETASKVWNGIKDFFAKWGATILVVLSGPIGWLVALIVKNWDTIKEKTSAIWNGIKEFMSNLWNGIKSVASSVWNGIKSFIVGLWEGIKTSATNIWNGIKTGITNVVDGIKTRLSNTWENIKSTATNTFDAVKSAITKPIEKARDLIGTAIEKIKGFFSGLKLEFPKIKMPSLPSFSISGKFGLNPPSVPKLKLNWNADGGIYKGVHGGAIVGLAEAGDEAVVPLSNKSRMRPFAQAVASMMPKENTGKGDITNNFNIASIVIREEADINKVAKELAREQERMNRAGGRVQYGN
jgi:phage-related minor tail protein